jgi:hypothetical protein
MNADGKHDVLAQRLLQAGPMRTNVSNAEQLVQLRSLPPASAADPPLHDWDSKDCVARPLQFCFEQTA